MSSEGFQLEGVLISKVELFLVFFMDDHQGNSFYAFFLESKLNSIEKGSLVGTDGVVNFKFGLSVISIKFGKSLYSVTHAIEPNWHKIELNKFRMLIAHVINSDAGNSVILLINVFIVELEELIDKGIRVSSFFEDLVDEFFVFGDFKDEFHPDLMRFGEGLVGFFSKLVRVQTDGHMRQEFVISFITVLMNAHGHTHVADLCGLPGKILNSVRHFEAFMLFYMKIWSKMNE